MNQWNRPASAVKGKTPRKVIPLRGILLSCICITVLISIVFILPKYRGANEVETERSGTKIKIESNKKLCRTLSKKTSKRNISRSEKIDHSPTTKIEIDEASRANIAAREAFLKRAKANPETWFYMTNKTKNAKQYFRTSLEQSLNSIFNWQIGDDPPIPPGNIPEWERKKLVDILLRKENPKDDDSEQTALNKEMVQLAKKELVQFIKDGGDPDEFIEHYYGELQKAYNRRQVSIELVRESISTESPQSARDFFEAVNAKLIEEGMRPIELQNEQMLHLGYTYENGSWK